MKRVLVVDDDPAIHLIVTAALEKAGLQITFAHTGEQALERVEAMHPDLILLDVNMPGIKGDDVMYEIRKDPKLRDTPVVFVTGKDCAETFDFERFGARGLITKPFDPGTLAEEISAYLPIAAGDVDADDTVATVDENEANERRRAGFLARAFKEIDLLERQCERTLDVDAARRITARWVENAGRDGHSNLLEVAQRITHLFAGGTPSGRALLKLLREASAAFEQAQRDEKWRLLDAELDESDAAPAAAEKPKSEEVARAEPEADNDESPAEPAEPVLGESADEELVEDDESVQSVDSGEETAAADDAPAATPLPTKAKDEPITIVVADDDPTITALVAATVKDLGLVCHTASGGEEAVRIAKEVRPDAAILDVNMPQMDGFEVLAALRADDDLCDVPVIMLTALRQESDVVRGFRLGADDYVVKPFNPMELSARLERLLNPRRGTAWRAAAS